MGKIEHYKPEQTKDICGEYFHELNLVENGQNIGKAALFYNNSPFPFYYLSFFEIISSERGFGKGKFFLNLINQFLDSRGKTGLLVNSILSEKPTKTIYQKNNWQEIPNHLDWYVYHPPIYLPEGIYDKAIYKINHMMDRL